MKGDAYSRLLRPLLFQLSADRSHELAKLAFKWPLMWTAAGRWARVRDPRLETEIAGIKLRNPIGLAAGFDKNVELVRSLSRLGFGYVVVGSITSLPRAGNPRPRLARFPSHAAIANSMGMPNVGIERALDRLRRLPAGLCPVFASVAGFSGDELVTAAASVEPYCDAVEIGLICPNSTAEERFEELDIFERVVKDLVSRRRKPVFIKLPTASSGEGRNHMLSMVDICVDGGIDAVCVSASRRIRSTGLAAGEGSFTGRPVFQESLRVVADVVSRAKGRLAVKGAGGVFTGGDAIAMLEAGASTVELYSAFIYRGWNVAGHVNRELLDEMTMAEAMSIGEVRGGHSAVRV